MTGDQNAVETLDKVTIIHNKVDLFFKSLTANHGQALQCARGCHHCCHVDLSVFAVEAAAMWRWFLQLSQADKMKLQTRLRTQFDPIAPDASGTLHQACVFLREGECTVYETRPVVCRSQGAVLLLQKSPKAVYDVCPLNFTEANSLPPQREWLDLERLNTILAALEIEWQSVKKNEREQTYVSQPAPWEVDANRDARISLSKVFKSFCDFEGEVGKDEG
jgi:uncharacterized protein